ncbi:hypothetical protein A8C32_13835 [Flavivirga aquatica]|uniref:TonB-dependent receptor n=1 Tax=Flavivirga aquatica TaxID=1849968 RepID=A0A1E5TCA1_9FLAO|nr:TonB-dependent receptor plug domain-containing protein [Flavivirga aquatica]OEK08980.1 hypothetical protein A8C32_13835 [Flavivirga aquatica]
MTVSKHSLYTFLIVLFSISSFSQKRKTHLESYLKRIETNFKVTFNYESGLLKNKFIQDNSFDETASLKMHISYLEKKFNLNFTMVTDTKIVISKFKLDDLVFLDFDDETPIYNLLVNDTLSKKAWITNDKGELHFNNLPPKTITTSHLNYNQLTINIDSLTNNKIYLQKTIQNLDELFIYSFFTNGTYKSKGGHFYIKSKEVDALAGLTSHDVIKNLENLPQVVSNSESISDLIIKGGTQDQNLFVWNNIKVYQNHHFFGLISAFNENLISTIRLYDNATPAEYGNNTSGVISLDHDNTLSKKVKAGIGVNFLSADAYAKIPITKKSGLQFSTRKSFTEFWESPTYLKYSKKVLQSSLVKTPSIAENNNVMSEDEFKFHDVQLQYSYQPNKSNILNVNGIYLKNNLSYIETNALNTNSKKSQLMQENSAFGINWEHVFSNNDKIQTILNYSKYTLDGGNFLLSRDISSFENNSIENYESVFKYKSSHRKSGFSYSSGLAYEYLIIENNTTNFNLLYSSNLKQRSVIYSFFGGINYYENKIHTGLDLRNTYYEFLKSFQIEPRFHFTFTALPKFDIQIRGERKTQNISQVIDLENNFLGIEKRRWNMANNTIAPLQKSNQLELSFALKNKKNMFNTSFYHKSVDGITTNNQGFQNLNQFGNHFGKYVIHGITCHYNYKSKNLNTWISYNYSINKYKFKDLYPQVFYNNNDIRNSIITGVNLKHKAFNFSVGMEYNSGKPFTSVNKETPIKEGVFNIINYNTPNNERLSNYLRFDATLSYNFNLSKYGNYKLTLGMINIGDKKNILSRYYTLTEDRTAVEVLDKYGLEFTPNLSINIDF